MPKRPGVAKRYRQGRSGGRSVAVGARARDSPSLGERRARERARRNEEKLNSIA
jgi:hypothetical protein